jgi:hypothetical protein
MFGAALECAKACQDATGIGALCSGNGRGLCSGAPFMQLMSSVYIELTCLLRSATATTVVATVSGIKAQVQHTKRPTARTRLQRGAMYT